MDGIKCEYEFIEYLNNKKYYQLNPLFQELILNLFSDVNYNSILKAWKYNAHAKADIIVQINEVKKGLSIKTGCKNSVHLEEIDTFMNYLVLLGFKEKNCLLSYLYSDGTINNTGVHRISCVEYKVTHEYDIDIINENLNLLKFSLIDRFLFKSNYINEIQVDAIIYGKVDDFLWATRKEIFNYLIKKNLKSSSVHVSNLYIQLWNKNLKYNKKYEHCRNYVQVKWYGLFDDMIEILSIRDGNNK